MKMLMEISIKVIKTKGKYFPLQINILYSINEKMLQIYNVFILVIICYFLFIFHWLFYDIVQVSIHFLYQYWTCAIKLQLIFLHFNPYFHISIDSSSICIIKNMKHKNKSTKYHYREDNIYNKCLNLVKKHKKYSFINFF